MPTISQSKEINKPTWGGWMTQGQVLLLVTALGEEGQAISAWKKWNSLIDFDLDHLDTLSYYILPMVYKNLSGYGYSHKNTNKLKGIYRRGWVEKQMIMQQFHEIKLEMEDQSLKFILLNDLASIANLYSDDEIRRPFSSNFWIHPDDVPRCLDLFRTLEIRSKVNRPLRYLSVETTLPLWASNHLLYTITWRAFPSLNTREDAVSFFLDSSNFLFTSLGMTLSMELHFIMTCMLFSRGSPQIAFNAIIDIAIMLKDHKDKMDWEKVGFNADHFQLVPALKDSFLFVEEVFANKVQEIACLFKGKQIPPMQQLENKVLGWKKRNLFVQIAKRLMHYRQAPKNHGWLSFPRYIQYTWGANGLVDVPAKAFERFKSLTWNKEA